MTARVWPALFPRTVDVLEGARRLTRVLQRTGVPAAAIHVPTAPKVDRPSVTTPPPPGDLATRERLLALTCCGTECRILGHDPRDPGCNRNGADR